MQSPSTEDKRRSPHTEPSWREYANTLPAYCQSFCSCTHKSCIYTEGPLFT
ncbi:hypothetical protein I79_005590 [Cricetulus griseus]|uniref:Uncharacterized protein n=1 Tax=Cricetulus griseus TaxID=10029 RepID=G3H5K7_CRIGR|nr:hypothetical protein I79_005590 [Cricetulus griseus]